MPTLAERLREEASPVLLTGGDPGARRSFLSRLAGDLHRLGSSLTALTADLGLPFAGPPGAVSRLRWSAGEWVLERLDALCSLDGARFRLPLLLACRRSLAGASGTVLIEVPRLSRGIASSELWSGFVESYGARTVLALDGASVPLEELASRGVEVLELPAGPGARGDRARSRTESWNEFLESAEEVRLPLQGLAIVGTPPPRAVASAWRGRQIALCGPCDETLGFGEIVSFEEDAIRARLRRFGEGEARSLRVSDARRGSSGELSTDRLRPAPAGSAPGGESDLRAGSSISQPRIPGLTLTSAKALLVNGVFGDPLLHVRLRHRKRSLLFDLGETARLPARIVHQVSDVFISHAHFDHIGGFLWLLRSCIGSPRARSLYGPPGLADHVEGMIAGIRWDRIGDRGPVFEVAELHPGRLERSRHQAGRKGREPLEPRGLRDDVLLEDPEFRVRAAVLDHGIPVLAFAFEETSALHVRPERLSEMGVAPGPWLTELKRLLRAGQRLEPVTLPDGSTRRASDLERELIDTRPGQKLVYATDLDESEENRRRLVSLASRARVLICEASFVEEDRELARASQHLTARGCGRIAADAAVEMLVPFHFSKRYERDPARVYREVQELFPSTVVAR